MSQNLDTPTNPTINDIARVAEVSLATVDRVLNARPGVREKTVKKVNQAIADLGYVRKRHSWSQLQHRRRERGA